jgi:hypothetical protein
LAGEVVRGEKAHCIRAKKGYRDSWIEPKLHGVAPSGLCDPTEDEEVDMRTRAFTLLLSACLGTVAVVSATVTVLVLLDNRQLRREVQEARRESDQALSDARRLADERSDLRAQGEQLKSAQAELAALRSSAASNAPAAPVALAAFRARTFLGQQCLGQAWIVPGPSAKDPATGQFGREPLVLLDESMRNQVGATRTNVVEREVARATTVNYNYPSGAYGWWPNVWVPAAGTCNPRPSPSSPRFPPTTKRLPQDRGVFLSTRFYQPPEKLFLPSLPRSP